MRDDSPLRVMRVSWGKERKRERERDRRREVKGCHGHQDHDNKLSGVKETGRSGIRIRLTIALTSSRASTGTELADTHHTENPHHYIEHGSHQALSNNDTSSGLILC